MTDQPPPPQWKGRNDGSGALHARWHQVVAHAGPRQASAEDHIALVGFASDEGVRRNGGRPGAAQGPAALRAALSPLALHGSIASGQRGILDYGDIVTHGEDLESAQDAAAQRIAEAIDAPGAHLTVILGGGHETAWAAYRGLRQSTALTGETDRSALHWGVLNLDAHFDLRRAERPTSGTPFLQMAEAEATAGHPPLNYAVVGIAEPSNTGTLFAEARRLGVRWMTDTECAEAGARGVRTFVEDFAADLDVLYLTVDLDVLPAATAPGVSAPAALGVETALVATAVRAAAATGTLRLVDVVELNPSLDPDGRTAKTGARLIDEAVRALPDH